jgi:protein-S-isoprenylcysteine O-methyltransferase Ste14
MNLAIAALIVADFLFIWSLPMLFFRSDGQKNLAWIAVSLPFFGVSCSVLAGVFVPSWRAYTTLVPYQDVAAALLTGVSIGLTNYTLGTHRVRLALWYQENDAPQSIVTEGAYRLVRHPFYSSFILLALASCVLIPHPVTLASTFFLIVAMTAAAKREEGRLSKSAFGAEYVQYMNRTGRFFPRPGKAAQETAWVDPVTMEKTRT